jgi:hypothetical protein
MKNNSDYMAMFDYYTVRRGGVSLFFRGGVWGRVES